ncbi:MAG: hypothetical protein ACO3UU_10290 [Minisyncoccia bacterium]
MSRYSIRRPTNDKETKVSNKISRALTEDFACDLDGVGYYISSEHPPIIFWRLETVYLAAKDEHDRIMGKEVTTEGYGKW